MVSKQGANVDIQKLASGSASVPIEMLSATIGFVYYLIALSNLFMIGFTVILDPTASSIQRCGINLPCL